MCPRLGAHPTFAWVANESGTMRIFAGGEENRSHRSAAFCPHLAAHANRQPYPSPSRHSGYTFWLYAQQVVQQARPPRSPWSIIIRSRRTSKRTRAGPIVPPSITTMCSTFISRAASRRASSATPKPSGGAKGCNARNVPPRQPRRSQIPCLLPSHCAMRPAEFAQTLLFLSDEA